MERYPKLIDKDFIFGITAWDFISKVLAPECLAMLIANDMNLWKSGEGDKHESYVRYWK